MQVPESYRSNLAYDFSRFDVEEQQERRQEEKRAEIKVIKSSKERSGSIATGLLVVASVIAVMFSMIYGKVSESEWSKKVVEQSNALSIAQSENARLQNELYSTVTLNYIENYATETLGLSKVSRTQVEYLNINTENLIEVNTEAQNTNIFVTIKNTFSDILEYLGF